MFLSKARATCLRLLGAVRPKKEPSIVPEVMIREMHYADGLLQMQLDHPVVMYIAKEAAHLLKQYGGQNYLSMQLHSDELGDIELIVRYVDGKTPAQRVIELEKELEQLRAHCT